MRVAMVGWNGGSTTRFACHVQRYGADELRAALRDPAVVVVLGPRVTHHFDPSDYLDSLDQFGGVALAIAESGSESATANWRSSQAVEVVIATDAMARIDRVRRNRPLRRLSIREWLGSVSLRIAPRTLTTLRVLPRLPRLVAAEWRSAIGASRRELDRMARREFGYTPGALLRDYRVRSAAALRDSGHRLDVIAASLGYSDKTTLCRALRCYRSPEWRAAERTELPTPPR